MADPLGVNGILENMTAVIAANEAIDTVKDIPTAFGEVTNGARIVEQTLEAARGRLDNMTMAAYGKVFPVVQKCFNSSTKLKNISQSLENSTKQNPNQKSWNEARVWYLHALEQDKDNRVECLLKTVMENLKVLCLHGGVDLHSSMEGINAALTTLDEAGPSLDDSEFNRGASIYSQQTVQSGGFGQQNTPTGGQNTFDSGHNISGGTVTYGLLAGS